MQRNEYLEVYTPTQAKEILQIGRDKMYELINSGAIRTVKIGRKYLIPKSALLQFLSPPTYTDSTDMGLNLLRHVERSTQ